MGDFIAIDITSDAHTLADAAAARLAAAWPGWTLNDADLEGVQIEALAPMAQNAAEVASRMPVEAFRVLGQSLFGKPYIAGAPASTTTTWALASNPAGRTIPAGSEIAIDGYSFAVATDQVVAAGTTTVSGVVVTATLAGSAANGLTGASVSLIAALDWVTTIAVASATSGGTDAELDPAYQDRVARELQLRAKTIVTTRDFEIAALSTPGIGRAVATNGGTRTVTVTVTDPAGEPVANAIKNSLILNYRAYQLVNTISNVDDAAYTTINVAYAAVAYPGFNVADLQVRINAALAAVFAPSAWGRPSFGDPGSSGWLNEPVVRLNKIVGLVEAVQGVNYVTSLTLNGIAADLTLSTINAMQEVDSAGLGAATAGSAVFGFAWQSTTYATGPLMWNATLAQVVAAFNAASSAVPLPSPAWSGTGGPFPAAVTLTAVGLNGPVTGQTVTPTGLTGGTAAFTRTTPGVAGAPIPLTRPGTTSGTVT